MINRWEILLEKGQAYLELQNYEKASAALEKALAEKPDHVPILKYLAECQLQSGKNQEGINTLEKIVKLSPADYEMAQKLGDLLLKEGKTERGILVLSKAASLRPNDKELQYNLGLLNLHSGKEKEAEKCFQAAIRIDPTYAPAKIGRAHV